MKFRNAPLLMALVAVQAGAQTVGNWTQETPPTSPSIRSGTAMAYDSAHGQVVLFGGYNGGYLNFVGMGWLQLDSAIAR